MNIARRIYYFFSQYANKDERVVALFFAKLHEKSNHLKITKELNNLLQNNVAILNLWSESKYKGYRYLTKNTRKLLYHNLTLIEENFKSFHQANILDNEELSKLIKSINPDTSLDLDRHHLLNNITRYFSPSRNLYVYQKSSSFGKLLRNPKTEPLVGDCNQIVTLYIYIYSRYFSVSDLKLRILPEHVALHLNGIDIEATAGKFENYSNHEKSKLLPVEEIVSINLLDVTDAYLKTHPLDPKDMLQASRLAYIISHNKDIVTNNLEASYGQIINSLTKKQAFQQALLFAKQSQNKQYLEVVSHNGAIYYQKNNKFKEARQLAEHSSKKEELIKFIYESEGTYFFNSKKYQNAIIAFKKSNNQKAVSSCYEALFIEEQSKLEGITTTEKLKAHKDTLNRMEIYAKKSGNTKLVTYANDFKKALRS